MKQHMNFYSLFSTVQMKKVNNYWKLIHFGLLCQHLENNLGFENYYHKHHIRVILSDILVSIDLNKHFL